MKTSLAPGSRVVTEYYERAGLQTLPRRARLQHRRLRLHDLHRQLGPAASRGLGGDRRGRPRRVRRALREPQLRGADPSGGEGELPRLAAARRRLRARGADRPRPRERAARQRPRTGARSSCATSGRAPPRSARRSPRRSAARCSRTPTPTSSPATRPGAASRRPRATSMPGIRPRPTCGCRPYFDGLEPRAGAGRGHPAAPAASSRSATRSRPTTSRRPARSRLDSPAGRYLTEHGVERKDFNSYGARRGNHEVMVRGTFANVRLRNLLVPGSEGTWTKHFPGGEEMTIFEASERYLAEGTPLVVLAGKEYGSGSTRDWAAKGPGLLGVKAVLAESYERIHRSNLLMMGILPLQYRAGEIARVPRPDRRGGVRDRGRRRRRRARGHGQGRREGLHRDPAARHPERARLPEARRHPPVRPPEDQPAASPRAGGSAVGDAREVRVRLRRRRDEGRDQAQLRPGHALHDELVAAELLGDGDDARG